MKKGFLLILSLVLSVAGIQAQQIPSYTQSSNYYIAYNPAFTGIKKNFNLLTDYRQQWVGFEGAPVTQSIMLDSRLWKGRLGVAGEVVSDETGPYRRMIYDLNAAYHIKFPDVVLSFGASFNENKTFWDARLVSVHNSQDPTVDRNLVDAKWIPNANFGILLHNDRYLVGISAVNLLENHALFYTGILGHSAQVTLKPNYYFNVGYNYGLNPDFIWQNTLIAMYSSASAIGLEYNLKLNMKKMLWFGLDIRLGDALAFQGGVILMDKIQIGYSYDFVTIPLNSYQKGTNEVTLVYKTNLEPDSRYRKNNEFVHQRYNLF
ncbi:MAG TPA: type IX secretion system membrane protein PorP/SprF [Bacteroidia bacterium]|jgi:type IX secretion system PorP/SprF family membrane protein|nr:type IX secretion system membrane protein PorP/SprF [Bacteroidia bacterium]